MMTHESSAHSASSESQATERSNAPHVSEGPSGADVSERRSAPRVPYDVMLQAAFAPDDAPLRFINVWGHDVSPIGISFLSPVQPQGKEVILRFGEGTRVLARICHVQETEHDGRPALLIGCEFIRE